MSAPVRRTVVSACTCVALLWCGFGAAQSNGSQSTVQIPAQQVTALDGHAMNLPQQLPGRATVLILGFGRHSQAATTAWEKPVRLQLAHTPAIGFYDMAMIAEVPGFLRPAVLHSMRKEVPDVLKPNFVPLMRDEGTWKRVAGYTSDQEDAAYVLLVDAAGRVRWSTHAAFTPDGFAQLTQAAQKLAAEGR